jgi:alcohol dehydrogenase
MRAARIDRYGGPDVVAVVADADRPIVAEGQLIVEVWASSLNPIDTVLRAGHLQGKLPLHFPVTLGGDFAGVVAEVGPNTPGFFRDDEVYGQASALLGGSGALAELVAASASMTALKPKTVDFKTAASLPLVGASAIQAIVDHMNVQRGQRILVHGGAGGIGSIAIQLAKHLGAHVAATARREDVEFVKGLGVDYVIDTDSHAFEDAVGELDAVLDTVGGDIARKSYSVIRGGGVLVSMVVPPDETLMRETGVTAIYQFTRPTAERLTTLAALVDEGVITPRVDRVFPLDHAADAFAYRETGKAHGKVVVTVEESRVRG